MIMIKGAKMPDGCVDCPCLNDEHLMFCQVTNHSLRDVDVFNERAKDCPLTEIPPHGRLIDADELLRLIGNCMFPSDMVTTTALSMATNWIKEAQTVIDAEDGE